MIKKTLLVSLLVAPLSTATAAEELDAYLRSGRIQEGLQAFAQPRDNAEQFSLGVLQTLAALQGFSADMAQLDINPATAQRLPFFRIVPRAKTDGEAVPATPEKIAAAFAKLRVSLRQANATLAGIGPEPFAVQVNISKARIDLDGDGRASSEEKVLDTLRRMGVVQRTAGAGNSLIIRFDSADAKWLEGYTHLVGGVLDILLAYEWKPIWNQIAHHLFRNPVPRPPLARWVNPSGDLFRDIADLIAALHDMRLELREPEAWRRAQGEFLKVVHCSRECWRRVRAETDDDHEWLPSPSQSGPLGARISRNQIDGWMAVLDELEKILEGEKLLPHWRMRPGVGIHVPKLIESPPSLDLVLWIQGSAFVDYLGEGEVSDRGTWRNLTAPFGGGFSRFAVWSN